MKEIHGIIVLDNVNDAMMAAKALTRTQQGYMLTELIWKAYNPEKPLTQQVQESYNSTKMREK